MAKIGISKVMIAPWTADDTYSAGRQLGTTAGFNGTPNVTDVSDYADDREVETDRSVTGGTLSIEQNELTAEEYNLLLGHSGGTANADDDAPYIGIGAIGQSIRRGVKTHVGKWYCKVKFGEPNDENTTKQETIAFNHTTLEGKIVIQENGNWKRQRECMTEEAAVAWLKSKANISNVYTQESLEKLTEIAIREVAAILKYTVTGATKAELITSFLSAQG